MMGYFMLNICFITTNYPEKMPTKIDSPASCGHPFQQQPKQTVTLTDEMAGVRLILQSDWNESLGYG